MTGIRLYGLLGAIAGLALLIGWALRLDELRGRWQEKYGALFNEAAFVLVEARRAADNPALKWRDVPSQIAALGRAKRGWQDVAELQSARIDALGIESKRLQLLNAELRRKAEAAIAKREDAIRRLERQAMTPGERSECAQQIRQAQDALDAVYEEGL